MESNSNMPQLKGKPFFEQLKLSINFIESNMRLIDHSVRTSNTDDEYNHVKKLIQKVDKYNEEVTSFSRCFKVNNSLSKEMINGFEDEIQNLKEILRCKEMEYQLEPYKYPKYDIKLASSNLTNNLQSLNRANIESDYSQHTAPLVVQPNIQSLQALRNGCYDNLNEALSESSSKQVKNNQRPNHQSNSFTSQERRIQLLNKNNNSNEDSFARKMISSSLLSSTTNITNANNNKMSVLKNDSGLKKKDTFILKENRQPNSDEHLIRKASCNVAYSNPMSVVIQNTSAQTIGRKQEQLTKENTGDMTNESIDPNNQFSFDFKLPYNKLKNNYFPSSSNYSVDESLEIEFTPGLKSRRTCKKKPYLNESNASTQDLQPPIMDSSLNFATTSAKNLVESTFYVPKQEVTSANGHELERPEVQKEEHEFERPDSIKLSDKDLLIKHEICTSVIVSPPKNVDHDFEERMKPHKLSTPKKPPNFDSLF